MEKLAETYFFKDLNSSEQEILKEITKIREVAKGEIILKQGQSSDELFIVRTGSVRVLIPVPEGVVVDDSSEKTLAVLNPGECFGEFAFVDHKPASATVQAVSDSTVYAIGHADIERTLLGDPASAVKIYKALLNILVSRFRNTDIELAMRKAF